MKKELVDSYVQEVAAAIRLPVQERHGAVSEIFSGICLLDALDVLLAVCDQLPAYETANLGRYFLDVDGIDGNEQSQKAYHCERVAEGFKRRLLHMETKSDGTCDGVMLFMHNVTTDCSMPEALCQSAYLLCDSPHVRGLVRKHLAAAIELDAVSTILEA